MIIHGIGHIKPDTADSIHDGANRFPFHHDLVVRLKAHQLGDLLINGLQALIALAVAIINGIDLLVVPADIYQSIPGDRHHRGFLIGHIIAGQQHGIGIAAATGIPAQHEDRIIFIRLTLTGDLWNHTDIVNFPVRRYFAAVAGCYTVGRLRKHRRFLIRCVRDLRLHKKSTVTQNAKNADGQYHTHDRKAFLQKRQRNASLANHFTSVFRRMLFRRLFRILRLFIRFRQVFQPSSDFFFRWQHEVICRQSPTLCCFGNLRGIQFFGLSRVV